MQTDFENLHFNDETPFRIFIHNLNYVQNHWHDAMEILFVLKGTIKLGIGGHTYTLRAEDLAVINYHEVHTTYAKEANMVLALQVSHDLMTRFSDLADRDITFFSCAEDSPNADRLRQLLAQMMWIYNKKSSCYSLELQSCLFQLLHHLALHFGTEKKQGPVSPRLDSYAERLSDMIHYLQENYSRDITLQELADKEYLSVSYISRFFKKSVGVSFKKYLIQLRLENAVKDLLYTDKTIAQLSMDNGFPNTNSFLAAFHGVYKDTPSDYRKKAKDDYLFLHGAQAQKNEGTAQSANYFELPDYDIFSDLYKYLPVEDQTGASRSIAVRKLDYGVINMASFTGTFADSWRKLACIGRASDILNPLIQEQLSVLQEDIGFEYLRFHGIFDDDMQVYEEDPTGQPVVHFTKIDAVLDTLCRLHLTPYLELGFMPKILAKNQHTVFMEKQSFISMPYDMKNWCFLVTALVLHCIERYGLETVQSWYFEFWNEPNIDGVFWYDSLEEYALFYRETYRAIKSVSPGIRVGGPALCNSQQMNDWLSSFLSDCRENGCMPDFISVHHYLHACSLEEIQSSLFPGLSSLILSADPDYMKKTVQSLLSVTEAFGYSTDQIHITEWNASPSHRDLSRDTAFMAPYLAKNLLENANFVHCLGYWTFTDYIEEYPIPSEVFHGGLGVVTYNGIRKAGYYAFQVLNQLGSRIVSSGPGYCVAFDGTAYQILLYNYCHYDLLYCNHDHSEIGITNRYDIYRDDYTHDIRMTLTGLDASKYLLKEIFVNRSQGSAFDVWVEAGAPAVMSEALKEYISQKAIPGYAETYVNISENYVLRRVLEPHELRLIVLQKMNF